MPDRLHFAYFRKAFNLIPDVVSAESLFRIDSGNVKSRELIADLTGRAVLKDQVFVLYDMLPDFLDHFWITSRSLILERFGERIHLLAPSHFGRAEQHGVAQLRVEFCERQTTDDLLLKQLVV